MGILQKEDFAVFDDIVYCSNPKTHDIVWVNDACEKVFGKYMQPQKCYEYFYKRKEVCKFCRNKRFLDNIEEYCQKGYLWAEPVTFNNVKYMVKEKLFTQNGKEYKLGFFYNITQILDAYNDTDKTHFFYEKLLNQVVDFDLEKSNEERINHILICIKSLFSSQRVVLLELNSLEELSIIEQKNSSLNPFELSAEVVKLFARDDILDLKTNTQNFYRICTKDLKETFIKQKEELRKRKIKESILMPLDMVTKSFLLVENPSILKKDENLYVLVQRLMTFIFKSIKYTDMLYRLSNMDTLTNLYNRNYYNQYLIELDGEEKKSLGVLFLDLNGLKEINDKFGHKIGDRSIISIAKTLKDTFTDGKIFRIGGDEFVVIVKDFSLNCFEKRLYLLEQAIKETGLSCSYGTCFENENFKIDEMIEIAENRMYVVKRKFHADKNSLEENLSFCNFIKDDIYKGKFLYVLQPKIDARTLEIIGAEALVRSIGKNYKILSAKDFLPFFEKVGCMDLIDYFMLEEICKLQSSIISEGKKILPISINISMKTLLSCDCIEKMASIFNKYQVPFNLVPLEIPKKTGSNVEDILNKCVQLKQYGFVLEMNDFGAMFSNIAFLSGEIFSNLKIDCNFIKECTFNKPIQDIATYIIKVCQQSNMLVTIEGVETEQEKKTVEGLNADIVQGYFFEKPLSLEDFTKKYLK